MEKFLTVREVSKLLGIKENALCQAVASRYKSAKADILPKTLRLQDVGNSKFSFLSA
jgi:predicted transcriptional regulator of viral defense system